MAVISVYQHGVRMGTPGSNKLPPKRGDVAGWTSQSARRNTQFLQSVVVSDLTGIAFTITLTVKDCPPTHQEWVNLRKAYIKRLNRGGAIRGHWVTEWQRRGVPHLHGLVYFPDPGKKYLEFYRCKDLLRDAWLAVSRPYGSKPRSQLITPVTDTVGWLRYLAKHVARGVWHYQRSPENVPESWQKKTGRIWGHWGLWPLREGMKFQVSKENGFRFRRLVRAWAIASARTEKHTTGKHVKASRRMLKCNERNLSEVRGVGQWCPQEVTLELLAYLAATGADIDQIE